MSGLRALGLLGLAVTLASCGGSGGGSTTVAVASTETFPLRTAFANLVTQGYSAGTTVLGVSSTGLGVTGSATVSRNSGTAATFNGQAVLQQTMSVVGSITINATSSTYVANTTIFSNSSYQTVAISSSDRYVVFDEPYITPPATVTVGDLGKLGTSITYADSTKAVVTGRGTESYVVEAYTATSVVVNVIDQYFDTKDNLVASSQTGYVVTGTGALTLGGYSNVDAGTTLSFAVP